MYPRLIQLNTIWMGSWGNFNSKTQRVNVTTSVLSNKLAIRPLGEGMNNATTWESSNRYASRKVVTLTHCEKDEVLTQLTSCHSLNAYMSLPKPMRPQSACHAEQGFLFPFHVSRRWYKICPLFLFFSFSLFHRGETLGGKYYRTPWATRVICVRLSALSQLNRF